MNTAVSFMRFAIKKVPMISDLATLPGLADSLLFNPPAGSSRGIKGPPPNKHIRQATGQHDRREPGRWTNAGVLIRQCFEERIL